MLSILIVNWNARNSLRNCLMSLRQFPPDRETEIIVVDNQSMDGSPAMIASEFPEVKLIEPGWNTGYAAGNNLAFKEARGEWLLTLNPDTEVTEGSLERSIQQLSSRPECSVLGAHLVGEDGLTQHSIRGFPTLLGLVGEFTGLARLFPASSFATYRMIGFNYNLAQYAPQPMGTYLLFKRDALEAIGDPKEPFDESFPIFFNEVDLLYRLHSSGIRCWYDPEVVIKHLGGVSTRQVRKAMIWESHNSLLRYLWRHDRTSRAAWPLVWVLVKTTAWIRAKGWSDGFRPKHPDL